MCTNPILEALTREGVLIDVSVRYWRAAKKLRPEDLGLDPDRVTDRLISLGHKRLLPRDALKTFSLIESRAHALIEASTFPFLGGLGHFLPNAKLPEVTTRLEDLEREFQQARQDFLGRYATLRTEATREWWEAARKLNAEPDQLVATIAAAFPMPESMDRYYGFTTHLFQVTVPEAAMRLDVVQAAASSVPSSKPVSVRPTRRHAVSTRAPGSSSATAWPRCARRRRNSATRCSPRCAVARPTASTRRP